MPPWTMPRAKALCRPAVRLRAEALEDRSLPSGYTVGPLVVHAKSAHVYEPELDWMRRVAA